MASLAELLSVRRRPFYSKKIRKLAEGKCRICGEDNYALLDVHRIKHGQKYSWANTLIICTKCHRLHHAGDIEILGWLNSTAGRVVHWVDKNGDEHFS